MSEDKILSEILKIVQAHATSPIGADSDLYVCGFDSLSMMELVLAVEDHFNVSLPNEALTKAQMRTPDLIANSVKALKVENG